MESVRVDVCYRPLRVAWVIADGDFESFRTAARLSFSLWGGRFNPIVIAERKELAKKIVNVFRADMVVPVGKSEAVRKFPEHLPHLINPLFPKQIFMPNARAGASCQLLDIQNALAHWESTPEWNDLKKKGIYLYSCDGEDPLSDFFLIQFGGYSTSSDNYPSYEQFLKDGAGATEIKINRAAKLPLDILDHPSISALSRRGLARHHSLGEAWNQAGFYSGDISNFSDLVDYWNLRAADIALFFVDPSHIDRYGETVSAWEQFVREQNRGRRFTFNRELSVWAGAGWLGRGITPETIQEIIKPFGKDQIVLCHASDTSWNGLNVIPPMMFFDENSTLGVVESHSEGRKISFALNDKPFCNDAWFRPQSVVASLSFVGMYGDEERVLVPPYLPELNEFYARSQHFEYNRVRSEPGRLGVVIHATDPSTFVRALPVGDMFERIFELVGYEAKLSSAGLIARQLIAQCGGVDGARVFKIPGVRRLLKTFGPTESFTKAAALSLIGGKDPDNPLADFKDYEGLYIEPRPPSTKLDPEAVFTYLVEKGLFRMGAKLDCPNCRIASWTALDELKQRVICELCGRQYDATRQLVKGAWQYRRSGVMGTERNSQGAIPVVLTLQQFQVNLAGVLHPAAYSPSLDLLPRPGKELPECEIDFVWMMPRSFPDKIDLLIGECKDRGRRKSRERHSDAIDEEDIENLRAVARAFPEERFNVYVVFVKLSNFTDAEIDLAKRINDDGRHRVVLLTHRELEPYHLYERTVLDHPTIDQHASAPEELARVTSHIYF